MKNPRRTNTNYKLQRFGSGFKWVCESGPDWESGSRSRQAESVPKTGKKEETSCLMIRLLQEKTYLTFFDKKMVKLLIKTNNFNKKS
jgi:hypothetical protein